jgi:hypothetical protein
VCGVCQPLGQQLRAVHRLKVHPLLPAKCTQPAALLPVLPRACTPRLSERRARSERPLPPLLARSGQPPAPGCRPPASLPARPPPSLLTLITDHLIQLHPLTHSAACRIPASFISFPARLGALTLEPPCPQFLPRTVSLLLPLSTMHAHFRIRRLL